MKNRKWKGMRLERATKCLSEKEIKAGTFSQFLPFSWWYSQWWLRVLAFIPFYHWWSAVVSWLFSGRYHKTIILLVVLYDCETWSLTLREECRLRVFENRILRRIFGPKRDENGEWRRLHNEKLFSRDREC